MAHAMADSSSALATRRIGMCGYTAVPDDGHTCLILFHVVLWSLCITILDAVMRSAVWLCCRFHIIHPCLHSTFPTAKTDLCSVVLYLQNQNSMETLYQPFWMAWGDSCFWSVEKTISWLCRMHIVKVAVVFAGSLIQRTISSVRWWSKDSSN